MSATWNAPAVEPECIDVRGALARLESSINGRVGDGSKTQAWWIGWVGSILCESRHGPWAKGAYQDGRCPCDDCRAETADGLDRIYAERTGRPS